MRLIFRYQIKELLLYQAMVLFGFGLLLTGQQVINTLQRLPSIQPQDLGMMVLLMQPNIIGDALPIALALSVLLLNSRMYAANEMYILMGAGVSRLRAQVPALVMSVMVGLVLVVTLHELKPRAEVHLNRLLHDIASSHFTVHVQPQSFYDLPQTPYTLWAERNDGGELHQVFIYHRDDNTAISATRAGLESIDGFAYFTLYEGEMLTLGDDEIVHRSFATLSQRVFEEPFNRGLGRREMTRSDLLAAPNPSNVSELMWRDTQLLYILTILLMVSSLSPRTPRTTPAASIFIGLTAFFIFNTLANQVRGMARSDQLAPEWAQIVFYLLVMAAIVATHLCIMAWKHVRSRRPISL